MAENRKQKELTSKQQNVHFAYLNNKREQYDSSKSSLNLVKDSLNQIDMSSYRSKKKTFEIRYFSDPKKFIKTDRSIKEEEKSIVKKNKNLTYEEEIRLFKMQCKNMDPSLGKNKNDINKNSNKQLKLSKTQNMDQNLNKSAARTKNETKINDNGLNLFLKSMTIEKKNILEKNMNHQSTFDINNLETNLRNKLFFPQSKVKDHETNTERKYWKLQSKMVYDENLKRYHAVKNCLAFENKFCEVSDNNNIDEYQYILHKEMNSSLKLNRLNKNILNHVAADRLTTNKLITKTGTLNTKQIKRRKNTDFGYDTQDGLDFNDKMSLCNSMVIFLINLI